MQVLVPTHLQKSIEYELRQILPDIETLPIDSLKPPPSNRAKVMLRFFPNKVYGGRVFDAVVLRQVITASPALKWIHNGTTGMDSVLYPELAASDIIITNGAGAHRFAIAETAVGMMLIWEKQFRKHLEYQKSRQWQHIDHGSLHEKTVLIVGLGNIGREIARLCHCFAMNVIGVRRNIKEDLSPTTILIVPAKDLQNVLPMADYVIVAAALTAETKNLIAEEELRLMKPNAYLVNIARGAIVNERALIKALKKKWIAGAALDVFDQEPLKPSSPLWTLPNVLVTPHNAAWSERVEEEALSIFYENFRRFISGEPLLNLVDKELGY